MCHGCLTLRVAAVVQRIDARLGLMVFRMTEFGFLKVEFGKISLFPSSCHGIGDLFQCLADGLGANADANIIDQSR